MKLLIFSQSGNETLLSEGVCIGERNPKLTIGDELKKLMEEKDINTDTLITHLGTNYTDTLKRVLNNDEVPKPKFVDKLTNLLNVPKDYFEDKELRNVIITDRGIVVAKYDTNERALEIKKEIDIQIREKYLKNLPIIIEFPME